jgi:hypothetical protein
MLSFHGDIKKGCNKAAARENNSVRSAGIQTAHDKKRIFLILSATLRPTVVKAAPETPGGF